MKRFAVVLGFVPQPTPKPIEPDKLLELALETVKADRFPFLATVDGEQPRVRPVSPVKTVGFVVYVANLRFYHKTVELQVNSNVELCYMDPSHNQVRISGTAEVVTDRSELQPIWDANPLLRQYLGSMNNPDLIVYCIYPNRVRYMQEWALHYYEVPFEQNRS